MLYALSMLSRYAPSKWVGKSSLDAPSGGRRCHRFARGVDREPQKHVRARPQRETISRHELRVDALGRLVGIDDVQLWWDTANPDPTLVGITPTPGGITTGARAHDPRTRGFLSTEPLSPVLGAQTPLEFETIKKRGPGRV